MGNVDYTAMLTSKLTLTWRESVNVSASKFPVRLFLSTADVYTVPNAAHTQLNILGDAMEQLFNL